MKPLHEQGVSCATCAHFSRMPMSREKQMICEVTSDFYGYTHAKPEGLCPSWTSRTNTKSEEEARV